jgi:hypothetical protein
MESLDRAKLIQRTLEISPTGYITIISILQGVAAAILADRAYQVVKAHNASQVLVWTQVVAVLLILTIVFHFYTATSVFTRWAPSFLDAFIPFCIGAVEIPPSYLVGSALWWPLVVGGLCVVAVAGLGSTVRATPKDHFANKRAHAQFITMIKEVSAVLALTALSMAACAALVKSNSSE